MTYNESAWKLENLRRSNDAMFRMAISHLMDVGIRHLTPENIEANCEEIMKEDDTNHFMTNEFKCELIRMAGELAKVDHIHLLVYISREMYYGVDDIHIDYKRSMELLRNSLDVIECNNNCNAEETYNDFQNAGLDDEELEELGYVYLLDVVEEDE